MISLWSNFFFHFKKKITLPVLRTFRVGLISVFLEGDYLMIGTSSKATVSAR